MNRKQLLNWVRKGCLFFLCIVPIAGWAGFWDRLFGENPREDSESIFEAIQKKRVDNVERLLERGVFIEEPNLEGQTPLLYATELLNYLQSDQEKMQKIILVLIAQGADLQARNQKKETPLMIAAKNGKIDLLKVLLENNAQKEACNDMQQTALMLAAEKNQIMAVEELLKKGAFIDSRDQNGMTPLMYGSYKGHIAVIQKLLQYGADLCLTSATDVTIVSKKNQDVYSSFSNQKEEKITITAGSTALNFAEKCGGREAERVLLEAWVKKDPEMQRAFIEWERKAEEL